MSVFVSVFTDDCDVPINAYSEGGPDASVELPPDARYIAVDTEWGQDIDVTLNVHPKPPTR